MMVVAAVGLAHAAVVDPGAGVAVNLGTLTGMENVETCSGIVTARLGNDFGGTLKASGGTLALTGFGAPTALTVRTKWTDADAPRSLPFTVRKNAEFDWFEVEPAGGILSPGTETEFTVLLNTAVMTNRHFYRGAFFVAATNGLSRPVSVSVETDFVPPFHAERPGDIALYADVAHPASGSAEAGEAEYAFDVTVATNYYFMIHGSAMTKQTIAAAVDGDSYANSVQQVMYYPTWTMIAPGKAFGDYMRAYPLTAGRHVIRIKADYAAFPYDGVVLTTNPTSFEPR